MKNRKGQALVEFILLIPVIVMLIFGMIELGNMLREKYLLENHLDTIITLYKEDKEELINVYESKNKVTVNFTKSGNLITANITKKVKLITPGLNIISNPYSINTTRTFYLVPKEEITIPDETPEEPPTEVTSSEQ